MIVNATEAVRRVLSQGVSSRLFTSAQGSAASPAISCGTGVGLYEVSVGTGGLTSNGGVFATFGSSGITLLNALTTIQHGLATTGILSPTSLTGNVTDYDPFGGNVRLMNEIRLVADADANRTINSLAQPISGRRLRLWNADSNAARTKTLLHDDGATGTAALRFLCPGNTNAQIPANGCVDLWYDALAASGVGRWRVSLGY